MFETIHVYIIFEQQNVRLVNGWMDDLRLNILFNSISVISGQWADDNEKAVCSGTPFAVEKISPRAGLEFGTTRSVGQCLTHVRLEQIQICQPIHRRKERFYKSCLGKLWLA